jgi:hypothetical protein
MSIMELGALGEFVGAITIVVTLLFIFFQLRQNDKSAKAATAQNVVREVNSINTQLALNRDLQEILLGFTNDAEGQTPEDRRQGALIVVSYLNVLLQAYWLRNQGTIAEDVWQNVLDGLGPMARTRGGREVVATWTRRWDPDFVELLGLDKPTVRWKGFGFGDEVAE